jgi:hypothetical protein
MGHKRTSNYQNQESLALLSGLEVVLKIELTIISLFFLFSICTLYVISHFLSISIV